MINKYKYSYSILRYVHDTATGEFVNVGVALFCGEKSFFNVKTRSTIGRVAEIFPDIKNSSFRLLMKNLSGRFAAVGKAFSTPLDFPTKSNNIQELIYSVLPRDDSSLIWSEISSGITDDPSKTLEKLYLRYVSRYDVKKAQSRRTDEDVWRGFKKDLEDRSILEFFDEKVFEDKGDEVKFPFAWKNGIWHCIEPISFDLSAAESIKDKAHKCLGEITSIKEFSKEFKLYLLVSPPTEKRLDSAFERAVSILGKMPIANEIYMENEKESLVEKLRSQIQNHVNS